MPENNKENGFLSNLLGGLILAFIGFLLYNYFQNPIDESKKNISDLEKSYDKLIVDNETKKELKEETLKRINTIHPKIFEKERLIIFSKIKINQLENKIGILKNKYKNEEKIGDSLKQDIIKVAELKRDSIQKILSKNDTDTIDYDNGILQNPTDDYNDAISRRKELIDEIKSIKRNCE